MTTSSPELVFHDTREECADSLISKLYLGSNSASDRFFGFTLLMLLELSALRRWDLSSWGEALHLQARLNAEIVLKEPSRLDFANRAVRNAVASFRLGTDDKWAPQVIRSLENLPSPDLDQLINDIINTNPVQYHCAKKIIEGLGDSIPESLYEEVAQWTVKYVSYAININQFGFNIGQIEFLAPILPEIPHNNPAWITLLPIFRNICSNSIIWQTSAREILRPILIYAPSEIAIELISLMLKIDSDAGANQSRWSLLCQVFENRNELADKFSYEFLKTAPSSDDLICLMDSSWSKKIPAIDEGSAKIRAVEHISKFIEKAVAKPGQKEFPMGLWSWLGVYYVKWSEEDKDTLLDLIRAIEALNVIDQNLPQLISYLTAMIANGPLLFSKLAAPKLNHWLTNPPIGINPMATNSDVFSIVKFTTNEKNLVTESLIYLAATVQRTLPDEDANYTIDYLCSISAEPPAGIASSIIQLALALAKKENNRRTELLGCCHAFLLTAHIRAKLDSTDSSDLIRSLRTLKHAMSEYSESPTLINELIRRIESLLCATAQSSLPKVRAATGALLTTLQKQISLSPALKNAYEKLVRDTRASVRRASGA